MLLLLVMTRCCLQNLPPMMDIAAMEDAETGDGLLNFEVCAYLCTP